MILLPINHLCCICLWKIKFGCASRANWDSDNQMLEIVFIFLCFNLVVSMVYRYWSEETQSLWWMSRWIWDCLFEVSRMKAIFYGLRNNHVYLVLITLVCGTVVLWAWEKTPYLTTILPPQDHVMRLSPGFPLEIINVLFSIYYSQFIGWPFSNG